MPATSPIVRALRAAHLHDASRAELLQLACDRLRGRGVCGTAVATGEDQNVPDVAAIGNYLACNLETKSELVVLIRRGQTTLGQLDIDSDVPAGFTESHHRAVKEIADALAVLL